MNPDTLLRVISLCVVLAGAETLHGIARTVWIVPRIGKERALKLSALTGSALAFGICWLLGLTLAAFMAAFDLAIGRYVMRKPWHKLWPDFNPATGNYLLYGLLFLCVAPLLVSWLRPQP